MQTWPQRDSNNHIALQTHAITTSQTHAITTFKPVWFEAEQATFRSWRLHIISNLCLRVGREVYPGAPVIFRVSSEMYIRRPQLINNDH